MLDSVRRATTGSLLAALWAGIRPATAVSSTEIRTRITAATGGRKALAAMPAISRIRMLMGMISSSVRAMPTNPAARPTSMVSALKTRLISRLDAPTARRIPISLVRSSTEMLVMMPIIMEDTTKEIATKAMRI